MPKLGRKTPKPTATERLAALKANDEFVDRVLATHPTCGMNKRQRLYHMLLCHALRMECGHICRECRLRPRAERKEHGLELMLNALGLDRDPVVSIQ